MTDPGLDFWTEHRNAELALMAMQSQLELSLQDDHQLIRQEVLNKCIFDHRLPPEALAFADHFWKCPGCEFCSEDLSL